MSNKSLFKEWLSLQFAAADSIYWLKNEREIEVYKQALSDVYKAYERSKE